MTKPDNTGRQDRRGFLKLAGLGAVGAGAAVANATTSDASPPRAEPKPGETYRETEHIRKYYELARG